MFDCRICSRCKKLIKVGFLCTCLAVANIGAHTHETYRTLPDTGRISAVVPSTATFKGTGFPIVGYLIPPST
jgi:hypothetical protein